MSKKRDRRTRDELTSLVSTPRLSSPVSPSEDFLTRVSIGLLEDRRLTPPKEFRRAKEVVDPWSMRSAKSVQRSSSRLLVDDRREWQRGYLGNDVPDAVRFAVPSEVAVCVRRKRRKEVLFARRKAGFGSRRRKVWKWSEFSHVRC